MLHHASSYLIMQNFCLSRLNPVFFSMLHSNQPSGPGNLGSPNSGASSAATTWGSSQLPRDQWGTHFESQLGRCWRFLVENQFMFCLACLYICEMFRMIYDFICTHTRSHTYICIFNIYIYIYYIYTCVCFVFGYRYRYRCRYRHRYRDIICICWAMSPEPFCFFLHEFHSCHRMHVAKHTSAFWKRNIDKPIERRTKTPRIPETPDWYPHGLFKMVLILFDVFFSMYSKDIC